MNMLCFYLFRFIIIILFFSKGNIKNTWYCVEAKRRNKILKLATYKHNSKHIVMLSHCVTNHRLQAALFLFFLASIT